MENLDPKNVLGSTGMLPDQCKQIWFDAQKIDFSTEYSNIKNIVICGMGGSAYGGHVVLSLLRDILSVPLIVNNDYALPKFADSQTLVILTSYSGSTEETIATAHDALKKGCKITALTSGGVLGKFIKENNLPGLVFDTKHNPSGQPRLGTGYIVLGTLALLNRIGLINFENEVIFSAIDELVKNQEQTRTIAEEIANKIHNNIPLIFASQFLEGNIHIVRNQINETAKSFADFAVIPELNHHLMEGLKNPTDKKIIVLFINSSFYPQRIKKRINLTKDVVEKNDIQTVEYEALGKDKISQVLNVLSFGAYLSFYMAMLYKQDPSIIPWVDYFKEQLQKA